MTMHDHLAQPNPIARPACHCTAEMRLERTEAVHSDTEIQIFRCPACERELRLTVWVAAAG
jgi:hypothetical protein